MSDLALYVMGVFLTYWSCGEEWSRMERGMKLVLAMCWPVCGCIAMCYYMGSWVIQTGKAIGRLCRWLNSATEVKP